MDAPALLDAFILLKLTNSSRKSITATGYEGLLDAFGLAGIVSISKFRQSLGRLNFTARAILVTYSERSGLSDMEPREVTVALRAH